MHVNDRFATWAHSVEETPEPFRSTLLKHRLPRESIEHLVFGPALVSFGIRSPATLLDLTNRRWLIVSDDVDGRSAVDGCTFDDTLLVELAEVLLYGRLRIDFGTRGTTRACAIGFNTVTDKLYLEAVRLILRGVEGESEIEADNQPGAELSLDSWPLHFRNALTVVLPQDRSPLAAVQWPAIHGGFRRELAPAAALLTTDRELVLISEERAWVPGPQQSKYGHIATYFPLVRLARYGIRHHERFSILDLEMHASQGGEKFEIIFPSQQEQGVANVVECARRQSSVAFRGPRCESSF